MRSMASIEAILSVVLPQVIPCPKSIAMDALQMTSMDFFRETGVWTESLEADVSAHDTVLYPELPGSCVITNVLSLCVDGTEIEAGEYEATGKEIILKNCPSQNGLALITASLRPSRHSAELPEDILEEWGDALAFGAIAKLKSMSGLRIEWTDASGAAVNNQLYQESLSIAKGRIFKRRHGGILYANSKEYNL